MSSWIVRFRVITLSFAVVALTGCPGKVPLRSNPGSFDLLAAHYFEAEKTQYIFFSIAGLRPEQAALTWPSLFELKSVATQETDFAPIDLSKAVHKHRLVACGEGRVCGSYSYRAEQPDSKISIRFRYHKHSPLNLEAAIPNSVHQKTNSANAQSALVYGVFSGANDRVQIRVHDNFGTPNSEQILSYGMERSFAISEVDLKTLTLNEMTELVRQTGSEFLFPADAVIDTRSNESPVVQKFSGIKAWLPSDLAGSEEKNVATFKAALVDKNGVKLSSSYGIARRNPETQSENVAVQSPMREARKIPLVLSYCLDREESAAQTSALFLDYQRFILGFIKAPIDACFAVGEEDRFSKDLERVITQKIADARQLGGETDFFFTVIINHRLSPVVVHFHKIIIEKIAKKVREERAQITPRLVGAFVYDSDALENRGLGDYDQALQSSVVWCPRFDLSKGNSGGNARDANCASYRGGKIDIGPANFLIPMGPFPTLDAYVDYVTNYSDKGLSRNPKLAVKAIRTNANSVSSETETYTFFDGERVPIQKGEGLRFCRDRDAESMLSSVALRVRNDDKGETKILRLDEAESIAVSGANDLEIGVGLQWEYPFLGGLTYETPVEGKVFNLIPIQTSVGNSQKVGDEKWSRSSWPLGQLMQKCTRYCDHPFFDEAGVYQIKQQWRAATGRCVDAKPVSYPGE